VAAQLLEMCLQEHLRVAEASAAALAAGRVAAQQVPAATAMAKDQTTTMALAMDQSRPTTPVPM
jgi:hypothetical protein